LVDPTSETLDPHPQQQAPEKNARQEIWTQGSLYLSFSYLCVLQVSGSIKTFRIQANILIQA